MQNESQRLTENVYLLKTPGHTSDDISLIVFAADKYGTLAVSGDTFISGEGSYKYISPLPYFYFRPGPSNNVAAFGYGFALKASILEFCPFRATSNNLHKITNFL